MACLIAFRKDTAASAVPLSIGGFMADYVDLAVGVVMLEVARMAAEHSGQPVDSALVELGNRALATAEARHPDTPEVDAAVYALIQQARRLLHA